MEHSNEKREVKTYRVKPSISEKMNIIRRHLCIDTDWWNQNPHTNKLGYWRKGKVSNADVLEIAINKLYNEMF